MASYRSSCSEPRTPESTSRIVGGGREFNDVSRGRVDPGLMTQYGTIDGGSFMSERKEAARYRYQLRAVSEHRGVPETGHFVTFRRGIQDIHSWYLTNDAKVTRVPYSQVAQAQAYLLYYERIQPSRWFRDTNFKTFTDNE
ncbi:unnamed protein product [Auanema sp. JU1783]|nr:unnamed protein product [Auanema sp. JU1783]